PKIVKVYVSKAVHGTKKDAQQVLNAWLPEKDRGTLVQPSRVTLSEYLDRWMQEAKRNRLRKNTFASYTWVLNHYVRPNLGHYRLNQITPLDIQGLYTKLAAPKPDGQGLAPRTVRYTHTVLSQGLKQAVRWRLLTANPALDVELPKSAHAEAVGAEGDAAASGTGSKSAKREIRA